MFAQTLITRLYRGRDKVIIEQGIYIVRPHICALFQGFINPEMYEYKGNPYLIFSVSHLLLRMPYEGKKLKNLVYHLSEHLRIGVEKLLYGVMTKAASKGKY